ncbi:Mbeg1-like protein [uncultured Granulicatella sp.]|uniref:Mbeg1-like protein n=1 Tax=uncultured Granulicatella sp. TaxID=316089 RepID=UPI0028D5116D|nr:Mbeg1-like protein [uncultured Granulicatella sp.]
MGNLITYVQQYEAQTFKDKSLTDIDILVLTEIAYLPFDEIVSSSFEEKAAISLNQLGKEFEIIKEKEHENNPFMITKERIQLLDVVSKSQRYKDIKVFGFMNDIDDELTKQFAAVCYQWEEESRWIIFRGTDESLTGWKEDFMMTYSDLIPAQTDAIEYLRKQAELFSGSLNISGHSKGGNLSLYASAMQEENIQHRIKQIYCWDAPGVHRSILNTEGYQRVVSKVKRYIPQDSIVGLMLESQVPYHIIESQGSGISQHSALMWNIEDDHFVELTELTKNSQLTDQTFKQWTKVVSDEDLKLFFDTFFELFFEMGVETVNDVYYNFRLYMQKFFEKAYQMDTEKREILLRVGRLLFQIRYEIWKDTLSISVELPTLTLPSVEELVESWTGEHRISVAYQSTEENEEIRHYYQERQKQKKLEMKQAKHPE